MFASKQILPLALDAAYTVASPFVWYNVRQKALKRGRSFQRLNSFFTTDLKTPPPEGFSASTRCWLHAVSVGESIAAGALFRVLKNERREWQYLVTTATETGQEQAKKSLAGADRFTFAPYDHSRCVNRFLRYYNPSLYCFFETEFWPNLLLKLNKREIPVFLVNGKLSEKSAHQYRRFRTIFRPALHVAQKYYMQTQDDAARLESIIGPTSRIVVSGNLKFDALPTPLSPEERLNLRNAWGIGEQEILVLAGSTHPREEQLILDAWNAANAQLSNGGPTLRLALVPRHPERFAEVEALIQANAPAVYKTSSAITPAPAGAVILGDQMGQLSKWFGACDIALLGGAWNPIGGHNLLEPAIHGIPVLRGPHMHAQPDIIRVLSPEQGGLCVQEQDLAQTIVDLARNPELRFKLGKAAQTAANSCKGAANRVAQDILALTKQGL